jgi:hypothetical protein
MTRPAIVEREALLDEALAAWAPALGSAHAAYRGHVYRVYNFSRRLLGTARADRELAVTSAFHDLGIWTDRTFDYLAPSAERAREHLAARGLDVSPTVVADAIANHHVLRSLRGGGVSEALRRADLVDLSLGWFRLGLDRGFVRDVRSAFPNQGFHRILLRTAAAWAFTHPLRPLPMLRFRATESSSRSLESG